MIIKLIPEAEIDLKNSLKYYKNISKGISDKFLKDLDITFEKIKNNPELYPFETKYSQKVLMGDFPYIIFFTIYKTSIIILAIFHTSRNPNILEERLS